MKSQLALRSYGAHRCSPVHTSAGASLCGKRRLQLRSTKLSSRKLNKGPNRNGLQPTSQGLLIILIAMASNLLDLGLALEMFYIEKWAHDFYLYNIIVFLLFSSFFLSFFRS